MVFNSYIFWFFFAVVIILYRLLPHRGQNRMLLVASYVFYGTWDYRFLSLIVASTIVGVSQFDQLYRMHLANLYQAIRVEAPPHLAEVISRGGGQPSRGGVMRHHVEDGW